MRTTMSNLPTSIFRKQERGVPFRRNNKHLQCSNVQVHKNNHKYTPSSTFTNKNVINSRKKGLWWKPKFTHIHRIYIYITLQLKNSCDSRQKKWTKETHGACFYLLLFGRITRVQQNPLLIFKLKFYMPVFSS